MNWTELLECARCLTDWNVPGDLPASLHLQDEFSPSGWDFSLARVRIHLLLLGHHVFRSHLRTVGCRENQFTFSLAVQRLLHASPTATVA